MLQHSLRRGAAARACHTNDSARSHARRAHPLLTAGAYRTRCAQRLLPRAGQEFYGYDQPMAPMYEQPVFEYEQPMPMQVQYVEQPHYEMMPMQVATSPMPVQYVEPMPMPMPMPMPPAPAPPPPPPVYKKKQGNSCRCGSPAHSPRGCGCGGQRGPLTGPHACAVWCGLALPQVRLPRRVGRYHVRLRGVDHGAALLRCQDSGKRYQKGVQGVSHVCALSLP